MKPYKNLGSTWTAVGGELGLYQHDRDFEIKINGQLLMSSRQHESELALARRYNGYAKIIMSSTTAPRTGTPTEIVQAHIVPIFLEKSENQE